MTLKRRLIASVMRQFGHPHSLAERGAGLVMAHRPSNRQRNTWVVSLLDVQPTERVLEVGFGPGLLIAELARHITDGCVYGIDHSEVMIQQASKRNAAAIAARRGRPCPRFGRPASARSRWSVRRHPRRQPSLHHP